MKILFLAGDELWFHRLPAARAAKDAGIEVVVMAPFQKYRSNAEAEGYRIIPWNISRRSMNPFREIKAFLDVLRTYNRERPDLVHHIALKAIIYGGTAARLHRGEIAAVNTVTGLGRVFTISSPQMRLLRRVLCSVLRSVCRGKNCRVTFENQNDLEDLIAEKVVARKISSTIAGAGLDTDRFSPAPEQPGTPIVMLPSRMLWEKGICEFVAAAAQLRQEGSGARFVLVGAPDLESRGCIPESQLQQWAASGNVEWWGSNGDMPHALRQAHVVCLPTYYREGMPRVLMEASACARAIVTTDTPGCREIVRHEENGLLVPPGNVPALAQAIKRLLQDRELRKTMGVAGRARAVRDFAEAKIQRETLEVYKSLLREDWPERVEAGSSELSEGTSVKRWSAVGS